MLNFEWLRLRNFLSWGNNISEIPLNLPGTTQIQGENLDRGSMSSGSGKSSLINALLYCLFDKTLNGITKEKLVNTNNAGAKDVQMEVAVKFWKDKDFYIIKRGRGKTDYSHIYKNGETPEHDITPDSVANKNKKLQELLGMTYEVFSRLIVFHGNHQMFLDLPVSEQRRQTDEIIKITMLAEKASRLKIEKRNTEEAAKVQEAIISQQQTQIDLHEHHVGDAEKRIVKWEDEKVTRISNIEIQLAQLDGIDFDKELELSNKFKEIQTKISEYQPISTDLQNTSKKHAKDLKTKQDELLHLSDGNCPYCKQSFAGLDAEQKRKELEVSIEEIKKQKFISDGEASMCSELLENLNLEKNEVVSQQKVSNIAELIQRRSNVEQLAQKIIDIQGEKNPHVEAYEAILAEHVVVIDTDKLDQLKKLSEHQEFLLKLLTDKKSFIRKKILGKTVPFLNKQIDEYVAQLNLPHNVTFQPDMSVIITEFGRELDHGNLSSGEQKRLNLALSLAFRDTASHLGEHLSLQLTDELDGGSVSAGDVDCIIQLLKKKAREDNLSIYCISHRPEFEGRLDQTITVTKKNGFSNLKQFT